jgi:hypothetical protein
VTTASAQAFAQTTAHPAAPADTRIAIILQRRPVPKKSGK